MRALCLRSILATTHRPQPRTAHAFSTASEGDLLRDGYTVIRNVLQPSLVSELQHVSEELLADPANRKLQDDKYTGSLIPVSKSGAFAELIAHPGALGAFERFGLGPMGTWMSGFLISKPGGSPSLGWHQDGWFWDRAVAYDTGLPAQIFAMYYLTDTTLENGCLRVIPGSHRVPHSLHQQLGKAHSDHVRSGGSTDWQDSPEHQALPGSELNLTVKAGDLVIGDARMLHGARANTTADRRSLITLWYMPRYATLGEQMKRQIGQLHMHQCGAMYKDWDPGQLQLVQELLPERFAQANGVGGDEYDHNLDFMHRQPGFVRGSSTEAKAAFSHAMGQDNGALFVKMAKEVRDA